jgi:hypothetical protein
LASKGPALGGAAHISGPAYSAAATAFSTPCVPVQVDATPPHFTVNKTGLWIMGNRFIARCVAATQRLSYSWCSSPARRSNLPAASPWPAPAPHLTSCSAREISSNHLKWANASGRLSGQRDWQYVLNNGPTNLTVGYRESMNGLVLRAMDSVTKVCAHACGAEAGAAGGPTDGIWWGCQPVDGRAPGVRAWQQPQPDAPAAALCCRRRSTR